MTFVINRQPLNQTPGYNEMTLNVSSSNYEELQYKYVLDTYVDTVLVSTSKLFPRPDGNCYFDAQPIVKNYLGSNRVPTQISMSNGMANSVVEVYVECSEQFTSGSNLYSSPILATTENMLAYEMVAPYSYNDLKVYMYGYSPFWDLDDYYNAGLANVPGPRVEPTLSYSTDGSKSISNRDTYPINEYEPRTISIINGISGSQQRIDHMTVRVQTNDNQVKELNYDMMVASSLPVNTITNIPVDIIGINAMETGSSTIPAGLSGSIEPTTDIAYSIEFWTDDVLYWYKPIMFNIDDNCYQYEHIIVQYRTPNGGWWYIPCDLKNYYSQANERVVIERKRQYGDNAQFQSRKVTNMSGIGSYILNTNWMQSDGFVEEVKDMLNSPDIYLIKQSTTNTYDYVIPVVVKTSEYTVRKPSQDNLIQYTLEFEEAFTKKYTV